MPEQASQLIELKAVEKVPRRRNTQKRKTVGELTYAERRQVPEEFELRGSTGLTAVADEFNAQRLEIITLVVHKLCREVRRINATLVMRGAAAEPRKGVHSETDLRLVNRQGAA